MTGYRLTVGSLAGVEGGCDLVGEHDIAVGGQRVAGRGGLESTSTCSFATPGARCSRQRRRAPRRGDQHAAFEKPTLGAVYRCLVDMPDAPVVFDFGAYHAHPGRLQNAQFGCVPPLAAAMSVHHGPADARRDAQAQGPGKRQSAMGIAHRDHARGEVAVAGGNGAAAQIDGIARLGDQADLRITRTAMADRVRAVGKSHGDARGAADRLEHAP